jgi:NTE family protein
VVELTAGVNLPLLGQVRAGWRHADASNRLETGLDIFALTPQRNTSGWWVHMDFDRLDRLYFPRSGWALQSSWLDSRQGGFSKARIEWRVVTPVDDFVLGARASWTGSPRGRLPLSEAGRLGGFLSLTGYASGQLIGDGVSYGHVRLERIVGRLPMGLRGDMRLGVALEAGKLSDPFTLQRHEGWLPSLAVYLGGETPVGPAYIGIGRGRSGSTNGYLFIGTP